MAFEKVWRRVYVYQISNAGSSFVKAADGSWIFVDLDFANDGTVRCI